MGVYILWIDELCNNWMGIFVFSGNILFLFNFLNEILYVIIDDIECV